MTIIQPPSLEIDAQNEKRYGQTVSGNGLLERRIVANLVEHMKRGGWNVHQVFDGEEDTLVSDTKSAMELLFNLDEATLRFKKGHATHGIYLVFGNGIELIADWFYSTGDVDGFNAVVDAFDAQRYQ